LKFQSNIIAEYGIANEIITKLILPILYGLALEANHMVYEVAVSKRELTNQPYIGGIY
jgi:hypothetical protein